MAGKHRQRQGTHGIGTRGPIRWERAAANALLRPNTKAARLYLRRVTNAFQVAEECRQDPALDDRQPYEHLKLEMWDAKTRSRLVKPRGKRDYVTCSVHCMVMQAQLDHCSSEANLDEVRKVFTENIRYYAGYDRATSTVIYEESAVPRVRPLAKGVLRKPVRCQVCGTSVK